ncbi:MAG TPA: hypothetical protein DCG68_03285 [Cryomorphaceae bacterium]|nr:hypothetical protein [Cryomorphaceae bacterium]
MADGTPGLSNVYTTDRPFEPGEPGDLRYYLAVKNQGLSLTQFGHVWNDPDSSLQNAEALTARIKLATEGEAIQKITVEFDEIYQKAALGHMRLLSLGRLRMPDASLYPETAEKHALEALNGFRDVLAVLRDDKGRNNAIRALNKHWKPAMVGWLRAYRGHLLELRNLWKIAPEAIKIHRPGKMPLVIPKGPKFKEMLTRWT